MLQSLGRYSAPVSLVHAPSLADFITTMVGLRFSVHTRTENPLQCRNSIGECSIAGGGLSPSPPGMCSSGSSRTALNTGCEALRSGISHSIPQERLIAWGKNPGLDIATFRVTPEEIAATGKKIVQGTEAAWPPPPNPNEAVFFGGFPGCERDPIGPHEMVFGLHSAHAGPDQLHGTPSLLSVRARKLDRCARDWIAAGGL